MTTHAKTIAMARGVALCALFSLSACDPEPAAGPQAAGQAERSPNSLSAEPAPMSLRYRIIGTPVVGQPVGIDIEITSPRVDDTIVLDYRLGETGSARFPDTQAASAELAPVGSDTRSQQFNVIPEREGRVYVIVSASLDMDGDRLLKSMSIPLQVARGTVVAEEAADEQAPADAEN